jgi:hypothetical protein
METIDLKISDELKLKIENKAKGTEFNSLEKYITYVLEQVTSEDAHSNEEQAYTEEEEEAVKERLKDLGYV